MGYKTPLMKQIENLDRVGYDCVIENYALDRLQFGDQNGLHYGNVNSVIRLGLLRLQKT